MILTDKQKHDVADGFDRLSAAQSMMEQTQRAETGEPHDPLMVSVRDALRGTITLEAFLKQFHGTVPPQLRTLVQQVLVARARGYSPVALAASSGDTSGRIVDDCKVTFVTDDDAVFLVMELAAKYAEVPPSLIIAVNPQSGHVSTKRLPKPIRNTIQLGLRRGDPVDDEAIQVLMNPMAEVYLG